MNDVEALPQMKLPLANDVGLRPTMLRFAQTDFAQPLALRPKVCYNKLRKTVEV
jgi:hypothetical protein